MHKWSIIPGLLLAASLVFAVPALPSSASPTTQQSGRFYPQTGKTLAPEFVSFFDHKGGLSLFGYPLTDPENEGGYKVQYLERARLEYHPEHAGTPYEVQLGLLGNVVTSGRNFGRAPQNSRASVPGRSYFAETGHTLSGAFLIYWQQNGGLAMFGYPISEPVQEDGVTVQYFERNRFELHPENQPPYNVLLGLLGRDVLAQRVQIKESSVTLPVYAYEQAFQVGQNAALGPYPTLNRSQVGGPAMRSYRLIVLENRYLRVSVLPELGGRLYEAVYKPTGHDELYRNPVIKPAPFGERGWWLGAGGTEWAAPTEEHGLMEYLPWDATTQRDSGGGASVTVSATDRLTGMKVSVTIGMSPEEAAYTVAPRMENLTGTPQHGQLWSNAMLAPGGSNHALAGTRFIVPTYQMIVHSTNDPGVPSTHGVISWPRQGDRDLSDTSTWHGWFGAFAPPGPQRGEFAAVYNPAADEGMVKTFKGQEAPGLKIFGFGPGFDTHTYTDDDSSYVELWGGLVPTFWDNATFPSGSGLGWTERWQPVAGTGGVSLANGWGTVALDNGTARVLPTRRTEGATLVLRGAGGETRQAFDAYPDRPAELQYSGPVEQIEVLSPDGRSLLKGAPVSK